MTSTQDHPLDEQAYRFPPFIEHHGGFLHSNNILFYFAGSPFFDPTSNNASLTTHANYNENFRHFVATREAFEGRLRNMEGTEFVVAYDPLLLAPRNPDGFATQEPSNVWVIRKQYRRKRQGLEDEVTILSTYFVVGDCIYTAPSVSSVLSSRMLSTVTSLTKLLSTVSPLPIFSPSYGHTYIPPVSKPLSAGNAARQSKENTPMPDTQRSATPGSTKPPLASQDLTAQDYQNTRTLADSLHLSSQYGKEYMDDNPLTGEPGNFIISKAHEQPAQRRTSPPRPAVPKEKIDVPTPPAIKTDVTQSNVRKASKGGEKSPMTPGKEKAKRRKSKAAVSTGA